MSDAHDEQHERARRRRDIWQLHLPLAFALILCTGLTIVEVRRASEGVWRAWAYSFEWPLIGAVCVWIWVRYRKEGSITRRLTQRWKLRLEQLEAESRAHDQRGRSVPLEEESPDEQLEHWQEYLRKLQSREPPGQPPVN